MYNMADKKKECEYCDDVIDDKKQTYVNLATITPKDRQDSFFHMECFKKNHEEKVKAKAQLIVQNMQQQAQGMLQNVLGGVGGLGALGGLLNPLQNNRFDIIDNQINKKPKKESGKRKQKT